MSFMPSRALFRSTYQQRHIENGIRLTELKTEVGFDFLCATRMLVITSHESDWRGIFRRGVLVASYVMLRGYPRREHPGRKGQALLGDPRNGWQHYSTKSHVPRGLLIT